MAYALYAGGLHVSFNARLKRANLEIGIDHTLIWKEDRLKGVGDVGAFIVNPDPVRGNTCPKSFEIAKDSIDVVRADMP